jgi:hypothetical protein
MPSRLACNAALPPLRLLMPLYALPACCSRLRYIIFCGFVLLLTFSHAAITCPSMVLIIYGSGFS